MDISAGDVSVLPKLRVRLFAGNVPEHTAFASDPPRSVGRFAGCRRWRATREPTGLSCLRLSHFAKTFVVHDVWPVSFSECSAVDRLVEVSRNPSFEVLRYEEERLDSGRTLPALQAT